VLPDALAAAARAVAAGDGAEELEPDEDEVLPDALAAAAGAAAAGEGAEEVDPDEDEALADALGAAAGAAAAGDGAEELEPDDAELEEPLDEAPEPAGVGLAGETYNSRIGPVSQAPWLALYSADPGVPPNCGTGTVG
jgi:hypothetical protein